MQLGCQQDKLYKSAKRSRIARTICKKLQSKACSLETPLIGPVGPEASLPELMCDPLLSIEI